jgi:hypothetical protein
MWFFNRNKARKRKVFGFLCDPQIARAVKVTARYLESPIYPVAEHLIQLGAQLVLLELQSEESKKKLKEHLVNEHLLAPNVDKENDYDSEIVAKALKKRGESKTL